MYDNGKGGPVVNVEGHPGHDTHGSSQEDHDGQVGHEGTILTGHVFQNCTWESTLYSRFNHLAIYINIV